MKQDIQQTWFFNQPVAEVWDYLTKPELIEQWLMPTDFKPVVGHKFKFDSPHGKKNMCEVLAIVPHKLLSYSWQSCSGLTMDSVVTWTLAEKEGGTQLLLQHNGFKLLEEITSHTNGWETLLKGLTELLNKKHHADTNA